MLQQSNASVAAYQLGQIDSFKGLAQFGTSTEDVYLDNNVLLVSGLLNVSPTTYPTGLVFSDVSGTDQWQAAGQQSLLFGNRYYTGYLSKIRPPIDSAADR